MKPRYKIELKKEEREKLEGISRNGRNATKAVLHAQALLLLDSGAYGPKWKVSDVAESTGMSNRTLEHIKMRFLEHGIDAAVYRKKRDLPPKTVIFDGNFEAQLLKLACSEIPAGYARWTLRILADKLVELKIVPSVSAMTICRTLKKMNLNLTSANTGKFHQTKARLS